MTVSKFCQKCGKMMWDVQPPASVSAGREATQQREEDISMEHTHGGEDNATD